MWRVKIFTGNTVEIPIDNFGAYVFQYACNIISTHYAISVLRISY